MKRISKPQLLGAFSSDVRILIEAEITKEPKPATVINLCSGSWNYGITVDKVLRDNTRPAIQADVQRLPFRNEVADIIIFDPPFGRKFKKAYGAYYANRRQVFQEVLRILKPGGLLIFSHYFIPELRPLQLERVYLIHNKPWEHVRVLSFSRKKPYLFNQDTIE